MTANAEVAPSQKDPDPIARRVLDPEAVVENADFAIGHTLEYVSIAGESTARARRVLLLLIGAAVGAFAAYWNLDHTFAQRRIDLFQEALEVGVLRQENPCANRGDAAHCTVLARIWDEVRRRLQSESPNEPLLDSQLIRSLQAQLDTLRGASGRDSRTLAMPVLDLTFEAPDLWLFSGVTFLLLLVGLGYAIACERRDVRQAFDVARNLGTRAICFRILAMKQVLTVPIVPKMPGAPAWRMLTWSLYLIPVLVQGYATFIVIRGRHQTVGGVPEVSTGSWVLHCILLIATLILTLAVMTMAQGYDADWRQWAAEVHGPSKDGNSQC